MFRNHCVCGGFCWMYSFCCVCVDQIFRKPATNRPFRWTGEIPRSKSTTLQVVAGITRIWWHWHYSSVCLIRSQILTWSLSNCPTKQPAHRNTHILFAFSLSPLAVELRPTVLGVALPYVKRTPKACEHVGRPDICTWRTTEQKKWHSFEDCHLCSRMRSEGFPFIVGVWGWTCVRFVLLPRRRVVVANSSPTR